MTSHEAATAIVKAAKKGQEVAPAALLEIERALIAKARLLAEEAAAAANGPLGAPAPGGAGGAGGGGGAGHDGGMVLHVDAETRRVAGLTDEDVAIDVGGEAVGPRQQASDGE